MLLIVVPQLLILLMRSQPALPILKVHRHRSRLLIHSPAGSASPKVPALIPVFEGVTRWWGIVFRRFPSKISRKIRWLTFRRQRILGLSIGTQILMILVRQDIPDFMREDSADTNRPTLWVFSVYTAVDVLGEVGYTPFVCLPGELPYKGSAVCFVRLGQRRYLAVALES